VPRRGSEAIVVLARDDEELATWPLWWWGRPSLEAVDELARLQLIARSLGCSIRVRGACVELCELLDFVGLREVLLGDTGLPPEAGGEAEGRE
jgi:hypothetical protein